MFFDISSWARNQQTLLVKGHAVHSLGFIGQMDSVRMAQQDCCVAQVAMDNSVNKQAGCVPIELYLLKQTLGPHLAHKLQLAKSCFMVGFQFSVSESGSWIITSRPTRVIPVFQASQAYIVRSISKQLIHKILPKG